MIDPSDAAEHMENAEATDPIDPIESADPTDPIDSTEPRDPIESSESSDQSDHFEPDRSATVWLGPSGFMSQSYPGCFGWETSSAVQPQLHDGLSVDAMMPPPFLDRKEGRND
jgi:hypothetical protein